MTRAFTAYEYQKLMIDHMVEHKRCAIWADMGLGKTVSVLTALDTLNLIDDVFPALILGPLRVAKSVWHKEVEKWAHLSDLSVSVVTGNVEQRRKALDKRAKIYTTNYEQIPWLVELFGKKWPFKTIVADESTKLKGFRTRQGAKRARLLGQVAHKFAGRFIELTGTPSPNGLKDLYGQIWFLDKGERLGKSYVAFEERWFSSHTFDAGYKVLRPLPHAQREIESELQDICISIRAEDFFDLEQPIENRIEIELPAKARKLYDEMEEQMYTEIEQEGVEAVNAAARTNKCLQFANGAAYIGEDAKEWKEVHNEKIEALKSVIEEANGMPVLVGYTFRSDLDRILKGFPRASVLDDKTETITKWNNGEIPILVAHPASAGHGLNLQYGSNILCFFGHNWNLEEYMQFCERIGPTRQKQAGFDRPVYHHHIIAKNTVEELVMKRLHEKREVQDILMDAMKGRTP